MAYEGTTIPIPLGALGLRTDEAQTSLPANALIKANNVSLYAGRIEKSRGTIAYNATPLSDEVVSVIDYWPDTASQRLIAVCADGKIYRDTGDTTFSSGVAIKDLATPLTTDVQMYTGGAEEAGADKKLFICTGADQIQVITGDGAGTSDIANPASDWASGDYPTYGLIYQNRNCVLGSPANPHTVYFSFDDDHENFNGIASEPAFTNAQWEFWRLLGGGDTDATATAQAGNNVTLFTTTNGEGFMPQGTKPFNKITFNVSTAATGSPVYTYEYWNGTAWTTLTLTTTPNYATTGAKTIEFDVPLNWATGDGTEGGANDLFSVRILASTAPSTAVVANSIALFNTTIDLFAPQFPVFPGEGDGIKCAAVYRGLLFLFKEPLGVYIIDGRDPNTDNWTITRYSNSFGVSSPHSVLQVLADLLAANSFGSYTSLQASDAYGDFEAGDLLSIASIENYIRGQFNAAGYPKAHALYYPDKKLAMFTGASTSSSGMDRILMIDVNKENSRYMIETKDIPNCLALRRDTANVLRPIYGATDGVVYLMDQAVYSANSQAYIGEFQTPYTDFSFASSELGGKNKIFDFISVNYIAPGNYAFYCDVYVDGEFRQTLTFDMNAGVGLDDFVLNTDKLAGEESGKTNRKPLKSCTGYRISFRFYNNVIDEAFKIERILVSFRLSAEQISSYQV